MPQEITIGSSTVTVYIIPDFDSDADIQDDDLVSYWDATSSSMKKATWANLKAKLATLHYTKAQVDALIPTPVGARSNAATLEISTAGAYVFYGTTAVWDLIADTSISWEKIYLANDGTGNVIIRDADENQVFELYPGTRAVAFYDGVNWIFIG